MIQVAETRREAIQLEQLIPVSGDRLSAQSPFSVSRRQASPNEFRARARRDMTVPIGRAVISEI